jgi:hypothetical protein
LVKGKSTPPPGAGGRLCLVGWRWLVFLAVLIIGFRVG